MQKKYSVHNISPGFIFGGSFLLPKFITSYALIWNHMSKI
uniref:Uncharacterized protein n=1 Tax=virus sp. ctEfN2 TaxID=2825810 RepID=A0A8S5RMW8_9VIRU|nr:MAG TPA: hypothetical protein [virus sp. ctEfN2]